MSWGMENTDIAGRAALPKGNKISLQIADKANRIHRK